MIPYLRCNPNGHNRIESADEDRHLLDWSYGRGVQLQIKLFHSFDYARSRAAVENTCSRGDAGCIRTLIRGISGDLAVFQRSNAHLQTRGIKDNDRAGFGWIRLGVRRPILIQQRREDLSVSYIDPYWKHCRRGRPICDSNCGRTFRIHFDWNHRVDLAVGNIEQRRWDSANRHLDAFERRWICGDGRRGRSGRGGSNMRAVNRNHFGRRDAPCKGSSCCVADPEDLGGGWCVGCNLREDSCCPGCVNQRRCIERYRSGYGAVRIAGGAGKRRARWIEFDQEVASLGPIRSHWGSLGRRWCRPPRRPRWHRLRQSSLRRCRNLRDRSTKRQRFHRV